MRTALLALLVVLAGCSGAPATEPSSSISATSSGPAGSSGNATAEGVVPPAWKVGQSWTWRVEGPPGMTPLTATTAVVAADGGSYQIGSPDAAAAALVFPFHLIAFGAVDKATLSWEAHGTQVDLLRFPLKGGDTWTADFWSLPGATVTVHDVGSSFHIVVTYPNSEALYLDAEWSPAKGQFTRVSSYFGAAAAFATATLTGEGAVPDAKLFVATELVRVSANPTAPQNLAPQSFNVPADADLVLLACFLGGGQGHFQATMLLADQQQTSCQVTSPSGGALEYHAATLAAGAGPGNLAAAPAGAGGVTVEVFSIQTA